MNYTSNKWLIVRSKSFEKDLKKLNSKLVESIEEYINELEDDPYCDCKKLKGCDDVFSKRFGKYRVLYLVKKEPRIVEMWKADTREQVYKI